MGILLVEKGSAIVGTQPQPRVAGQGLNKQPTHHAQVAAVSRHAVAPPKIASEQRQKKTAISAYTEMAARAKMRTSPPDC